MKKQTVRVWVNLLALLAVLVVNGLANALPLNGQTTGEISDSFDVYFVPAGYVFSIWGLIYLLLIGFVIYQLLPSQRDNPWLSRVGYLFTLSCLANAAWIFLWHYEYFILTLVAMVTLLVSLIAIYVRLGIGKVAVDVSERLLARLPFRVYLGWVTVATIANVTSVLDYVGWNGWGISEPLWTIVMLVVATALTALMVQLRNDVAYALVVLWAFIGIAVRHWDTRLVGIAAAVAAACVAGLAILAALQPKPLQTAEETD